MPRTREETIARILVHGSADGLCAMDREMRYTLWNPTMERFSGKRADEVLGKKMLDVFPFLRDVGLDEAMERTLAGETVVIERLPHTLPNGEVHIFNRRYAPLRDDEGVIVGTVNVVRDVTAELQAEEALRASEAKLRLAVDASGIGIWSWDATADVVTWDDRVRAIFGASPGFAPKGKDGYLALVHPEDRARASATRERGIRAGTGWRGEHRIVRPDGSVRWVLARGAISEQGGRRTVGGVQMDVTERHAREEQVRQAQKLEAVGQLTAGIAHNFNNILMALIPNLELAASAPPAEAPRLLASAREAAARAADLVRGLISFAGRNHAPVRTVEPVGDLVARTLAFCRGAVDPRIAIDGTYDASAFASVDAAQLEQAVVNVVINARDAVVDATVSAPRIAVDVVVVRDGAPELAGRVGDYVRVRIEDNGVGMDRATAARVFEPFFTTKEVGNGTGLGLATTHTTLRDHGGFITCESEPGKGTTFALYVPRAAPATATQSPEARPAAAGGRETVLVVDDEAPVRIVVAKMLSFGGYTAVQAASGQEAMQRLSDPARAKDVALILLDVSMPGLSGAPLRRRLSELAPHARVVFCTGFAEAGMSAEDRVLEKPFTADRLLATVREVLDGPRP